MSPIFEFTPANISEMLAYTGNVISSLMPLIVVVIGIGIALWIFDHFLLKR